MEILLIEFLLGVGLLLAGTHHFVKLAEKISGILRISPLIVGTTVVALGTSMPELAVSLIAAFKGDTGLAMGNIIGSNIINIFMVLPVGIFIGKLRIGTTKTQRNAIILLGLTGAFVLLQKLPISPLTKGLVLLALAISISLFELRLGILGRKHEDANRFKQNSAKDVNLITLLLILLLTLAGVVAGGVLTVTAIEEIAGIIHYSTTLLGLTLVAAATSLPELMTTIFSQEEHEDKITIGNIIGSNIYNLIFIGGIITLFPVVAKIELRDGIWLAISTVSLVLILKIFSGKQVPKKVGIILLLLFLLYLVTLIKT